MNAVTRILDALVAGEATASDKLLPLVYSELRRLAAQHLHATAQDESFQATELVHEAFLRLVDVRQQQSWDSRAHFFGAAALAMRRILIERARKRKRIRHGGSHQKVSLTDVGRENATSQVDVLALDEALQRMAEEFPKHAELVNLRYFAGLKVEDAGRTMGISRTTATRYWVFAKAWLLEAIEGTGNSRGRTIES